LSDHAEREAGTATAGERREQPHAQARVAPTGLSTAFFYGCLLLLLYLAYQVLLPFAAPILWAAVLVVVFYPSYQWLLRLVGRRAGLAACLLTTAVILAVVIPAFLGAWVLAREATSLYQTAQRLYEAQGLEGIATHPVVAAARAVWERVRPPFERLGFDLKGLMLAAVNTVSSFMVENLKGVARNVLTFSIDFLLTAFTLFFFLRDGTGIVQGVQTLLPLERAQTELLFARLYEAVSAVVRGTLVTALAQGALGALGYWFFGVPFPVFLGVATSLLSLLPVGGSALVWIPAAIYLLLTGSWLRGALLVAWSALAVSTADNVLKPLLMAGRTNLPTLFLFFGMLGGLELFGVIGFVLGPVLLVMLATFLEMYREVLRPPAARDPKA
jgi:predicted PurR-regulated permease PerM